MPNSLRRALLERRLTRGGWIQIGHPAVGEILAKAGFDWICVDLEHGVLDLCDCAALFRGIERYGSLPIARLPVNDPVWIHRVLDAGAQGLVIPLVNSAAEADAAVCAAKYPPRGARGYGYCRANDHGESFDAYRQVANEELPLIMQIEHIEGIEHLEDILAVQGVDGVFIGPLDLSGSLGVPGDLAHPRMKAALTRYREICVARGVSYGLHIVRPDEVQIRQALAEGYSLLALGLDTVFLAAGAQAALGNHRVKTVQ